MRIHLNTFLIRANVRVPKCIKRGARTEERHQFFTVLAVVDKKLCSFIVPIAIVSSSGIDRNITTCQESLG